MTPRENVRRTVGFQNPERLAHAFAPPYDSDIVYVGVEPFVDGPPPLSLPEELDEWGCLWSNAGNTQMGQVTEPLWKNGYDFSILRVPDACEERRWTKLRAMSAELRAGDKYVIAFGNSLYHRLEYLRGVQNLWEDIYLEEENLRRMIDILVEMHLKMIQGYHQLNCIDAYMFCDDWGMQDRLSISPQKWREIWKEPYRKVFAAAHDAGMQTWLHSCGYIVDILDDLIEVGLDVIEMQQQQNMGLDLLRERFRGKITFFCPVDIQNMMIRGTPEEIYTYAQELVKKLSTPSGGFIADYYLQSKSAGHTPDALNAMCRGFLEAPNPYAPVKEA